MSNKEIVANFYNTLTNSDDVSQALLFLDPDVLWCAAHPVNNLKGHDEFLARYWNPIKTALPDVEYKPFIVLGGEYPGWALG